MEEHIVGPLRFSIDLSFPIYEQIMNQIRHAVARGEIALGTKLPSVREMAKQLKINPSTVVRAYHELERSGLCEKRVGQGTFITKSEESILKIKKELAEDAIRSFISSMKDLGIDRQTAEKWIQEADWL